MSATICTPQFEVASDVPGILDLLERGTTRLLKKTVPCALSHEQRMRYVAAGWIKFSSAAPIKNAYSVKAGTYTGRGMGWRAGMTRRNVA